MQMKLKIFALVPAVAATVLLIAAPASASGGNTGFGFNATGISGVDKTGVVTLTGGGAYNLDKRGEAFAKSAGGFRCTAEIALGPLGGCLRGEGVRWDTAGLLTDTMFRCVAGEALKMATTDQHTVVLLADFYRAGDGNVESFTAQMIVSDEDIDSGITGVPGIQNVWIQGVGCASAIANFSS
jgi:hypothetical protein